MIITKKRFEREVKRRMEEYERNRCEDEMIRDLRRDMYTELERLRSRVDCLEAKLHSAMADNDGEGVRVYRL